MKISSPLALFAVFVGLSEVGLGIGVNGTSEASQVVLIWFMCLLAATCFLAFLGLLIWKPHALYPPSEFGKGGATFQEYANHSIRQVKSARIGRLEADQISATDTSSTDLEGRILTYMKNLGHYQAVSELATSFAFEHGVFDTISAVEKLIDSGGLVRMNEDDDWGNTPIDKLVVVEKSTHELRRGLGK